MARSDRRSLVWLPVLAAVAVALARLPVLLAHQDSHFPFELFSGSVAAALIDGLHLDLPTLTVIPHIRGGPLFGVLAAPLFVLLGETLLVLKLVPLLWHALAAGLTVLLLHLAVGRSAARVGTCLLICATPLIAKLSVLGLASHLESAVPSLWALLVWCPLVAGRWEGRLAHGLFGLALGFGSFFHLQSLLLCLILLGLLALRHPRRLWFRCLPLLLGVVIGVLPQLLFQAADFEVGQTLMGKVSRQTPAHFAPGPYGEVCAFGWENKATGLAMHGLAPVLEFDAESPLLRKLLSYGYSTALLVGAAWAVWRSRRPLADLLRKPFSSGGVAPDLTVALILHCCAVGLLFVISGIQVELWFVGTGLAGRRLAPLCMSLVILASIGLARREERPRWPFQYLLIAVLLICGTVGTVLASQGTEAARLTHRGERYEWFGRQLEHEVEGDPRQMIELIRRIDRGDFRFAHMRFSVRGFGLKSESPLQSQVREARKALPLRLGPMFALNALGRRWGEDVKLLQMLRVDKVIATLLPVERRAFLHGIGQGLMLYWSRPSVSATPGVIHPLLPYLANNLPKRWAGVIFEGMGFSRGQVYDPYNHYMAREIGELGQLNPRLKKPLLRGFGWGHRQRYVVPPVTLPDGLPLVEQLSPEDLEAYLEGYLGQVLPPEAGVLGR
ncbi:MAG: hypothetical protein ACI9EF_003072 [Pseudohongiellaceae bacterium]|jgi:hypothetical protein